MEVNLRVQSAPRRGSPGDDDALGAQLVDVVERAFEAGGAPSAAIAAGEDRLHILPLAPFVSAKIGAPWLLAGLSRRLPGDAVPEGALSLTDAVGLVGTFRLRARGQKDGIPVLLVFLEWTDGRWWMWRAFVDPSANRPAIREGTAERSRAVDGAPRPDGLGGWWTLGRTRAVDLRWRSAALVH